MPEPGPAPSPASPEPSLATTASEAIARALAAYESLASLAETIEDEWTYVTALAEAGRRRIAAAASKVVAAQPPAPAVTSGADATVEADRARAVRLAAAEIGAITDPHRAIDWLSTFPAVVELALAPAARGQGA